MRWNAAVVVERELKAPMLLTNPFYPADQRILRLFARLKGRQRDMWSVAPKKIISDALALVQPVMQSIVGRKLLLLFHQPVLQVTMWINDQQVFRISRTSRAASAPAFRCFY